MARNYFVTGGAGFIGSNYVHRLIQRGENVTVYDNLSRAGAPKNVAWLEKTFGKDAFKLIVGDVRDADLLSGIRQRCGCDRPSGGAGGGDHLGHQPAR